MHSRKAWFILTSCLSGVIAVGAVFGGSPDMARENPLLREHFRQLITGIVPSPIEFRDPYSTRSPDPFLELRVDWLIQEFFAQLNQRIDTLKSRFDDVMTVQEQLSTPGAASRGHEKQVRWKQSLRGVEDEAEEIRDMLRPILPLPSKADFKPEFDTGKDITNYRHEVEYIGREIAQAEQGIRDLFLAPTHTVDIRASSRGNLLINLYRVQKMSEALRKTS